MLLLCISIIVVSALVSGIITLNRKRLDEIIAKIKGFIST